MRRQRNLSQGELGELAQVHYTHISRYERGVSKPKAATLQRLANALGVSSDFLMDGPADEAAKARAQVAKARAEFVKNRNTCALLAALEGVPVSDDRMVTDVILAMSYFIFRW